MLVNPTSIPALSCNPPPSFPVPCMLHGHKKRCEGSWGQWPRFWSWQTVTQTQHRTYEGHSEWVGQEGIDSLSGQELDRSDTRVASLSRHTSELSGQTAAWPLKSEDCKGDVLLYSGETATYGLAGCRSCCLDIPSLYETQISISVSTGRFSEPVEFCARTHAHTPCFLSIRSKITSRLHLRISNRVFRSYVPAEALYLFAIIHACYMRRLSDPSWLNYLNDVWRWVQLWSSLRSNFFRPSSKYSPRCPVIKHPQSLFFPQRERSNFTRVQNNRPNYYFVYFDCFDVRR
jgi:hypothetical protein